MPSLKVLSMPFQVGWDIVHRCNFRCSHCFFTKEQLGDPSCLTKQQALDFVRYLAEGQVLHLSIAGGEPLLYPHIVDVVREATRNGLVVAMSTNAALLSDSLAKELRSAGLRYLQISLDGSTAVINDRVRGIGTFNRTLRGLRIAVENGFEVLVAFVILRSNAHDVENVFQLAVDEKAIGVKVQTFIKNGLGESNASELELTEGQVLDVLSRIWKGKSKWDDRLKLLLPLPPEVIADAVNVAEPYRSSSCLGCQPGLSSIRVNNCGDVRACGAVTANTEIAGNILVEPLQDIWLRSRELAAWRNNDLQTSGATGTSCGSICGKGCRSANVPRNHHVGTPVGNDQR